MAKVASLRRFLRGNHHLGELLRGSAFTLVARALGVFAFFGTSVGVSRYYGIDEFGRFSLGLALVNVVSVVTKLGADQALMRLHAEYAASGQWRASRTLHRHALALIGTVSLVVSAGLVVASDWLAVVVFDEPNLRSTLWAAAVAITPLSLMNVFVNSLRGFGRLASFAWFKFAFVQASTLALLVIQATFWPHLPPIWAYVASTITGCVVVAFLVWQSFALCPKDLGGLPTEMLTMVRLSLWLGLAAAGWGLMEWADSLILGRFGTAEDVGTYQAAYRLATAAGMATVVIGASVSSQFATLHSRDDRSHLRDLVQLTCAATCALTLVPSLALSIAPGAFLGIFNAPSEEGRLTLAILAVAILINSVAGPIGPLMLMTGGHRLLNVSVMTALAINLALNLILIPQVGMVGAAVAQVGFMAIFNAIALAAVRRRFGFWALPNPRQLRSAIRRLGSTPDHTPSARGASTTTTIDGTATGTVGRHQPDSRPESRTSDPHVP